MGDEVRKCQFCEGDAILSINTIQYLPHPDGSPGSYRSYAGSGEICAECCLKRLVNLENAHHFIFRIDAPYTPDGTNYDDGLRMSVEACADYNDQTVEEFMRLDREEGV